MSHDIFLSYAHQDRHRVEPLVKAIEAMGFDIWWDHQLIAGDRWSDEIKRAMESAKCLLVFWSTAAQESAEVQTEAAQALQARKLIMVAMDSTALPEGLLTVHLADLTDWDGRQSDAAFQRLVSAIATLVGQPPKGDAPVQPEHRSQPTRRLRIPDIAWVEIPGGPFIYQNGETRELPTFWIGRYPVTNAQYQTFIDDGGYEELRWWEALVRPEPVASRWPQVNRPRTNVDWYEAVAFSRWLNARLGLPEGSIRLPTEMEWEKVARGPDGFVYPWGNEYRSGVANIRDETDKDAHLYLEQTLAVGTHPQSRSPYGVEDLAGNVLEWCLNKSDEPELIAADLSGDQRSLRGGSWFFDYTVAVAAAQFQYFPSYRDDDAGFRVSSSRSMPLSSTRRQNAKTSSPSRGFKPFSVFQPFRLFG